MKSLWEQCSKEISCLLDNWFKMGQDDVEAEVWCSKPSLSICEKKVVHALLEEVAETMANTRNISVGSLTILAEKLKLSTFFYSMSAKTVVPSSATNRSRASSRNFKQVGCRSFSILDSSNRRWNMAFLVQYWRQSTTRAMATKRWIWSSPIPGGQVKGRGYGSSFLGEMVKTFCS